MLKKENKSPAFQFYAQDFLMGTITMTAEQAGAYIFLLAHEWDKGGLVDDMEELMKLARCNEETLMVVLRKFIKNKDGFYVNNRLENIREEQQIYRTKKSEAGKLGADIKYGKRSKEPIQTPVDNTLPIPADHTGDFFYIGLEIYKMPVSRYIKLNMKAVFLDPWQMKNPSIKADDVLRQMDAKVGHQYTNEVHIKNTFNKIVEELKKPAYNKNSPIKNDIKTTSQPKPFPKNI
jgi:uncharacterized protein YdaU (DUF1376 family)